MTPAELGTRAAALAVERGDTRVLAVARAASDVLRSMQDGSDVAWVTAHAMRALQKARVTP